MIFWDVQHGNAAFLRTPSNKKIVFDLGSGSYSKGKSFSPLLHLKGKRKSFNLDYVFISHPHHDHFSDISNLQNLGTPKRVVLPKHIDKKQIMNNVWDRHKGDFESYLALQKTAIEPQKSFSLDGVKFRVFQSNPTAKSNMNNLSNVVVVEYDGYKIVLPGDNESASFKYLFETYPDFEKAISNADILLAPHHGRQNGFHRDFVKTVNPNLTVISDGSKPSTHARDRYSKVSSGLFVHNKSTKSNIKRYALSTQNDGYVLCKIGRGPAGRRFLKTQIG